jgi:hypothetical protein
VEEGIERTERGLSGDAEAGVLEHEVIGEEALERRIVARVEGGEIAVVVVLGHRALRCPVGIATLAGKKAELRWNGGGAGTMCAP